MSDTADRRLERQLAFAMACEPLKTVTRHSPVLRAGRPENSAEHSWHVALMAWLLAEHADASVDVGKVITMMLVHDLGEVDAGDVFVYDAEKRAAHHAEERAGIERLAALLPDDQGHAVRDLWEEFEAGETAEARFARALDRLQPLVLNYHSEGEVWRAHDIREARVVEINSAIAEGSSTLWARAKRLIADAVNKGFLKS